MSTSLNSEVRLKHGKFLISLLGAIFTVAFLSGGQPDCLSSSEKAVVLRFYKFWKQIGSGAMMAPFGRSLALSAVKDCLFLKLEKHFSSSSDQVKASRFSWIHMTEEGVKDSGSFLISEDRNSEFNCPNSGFYWNELAGFRCQCSLGDWIYFEENFPEMKMARTDYTEDRELRPVRFPGVMWFSKLFSHDYIGGYQYVVLIELSLNLEPNDERNPMNAPEKSKNQPDA